MYKLVYFFSFFVILSFIALFSPKLVIGNGLLWSLVYPTNGEPTAIKFSPIDTNLVYASIRLVDTGDFDLLKSTDRGLTWSSIKGGLPPGLDANWISLVASDPSMIAISLWGSGVHLSEDWGQTWSQIFSISPFSRSVEIDPVNVDKIFAGIGGSNSNSGVYVTTSRGASWNRTLLTTNNSQIVIDGENTQRVFADSGPNFYRSMDGGNTWYQLSLNHAFSNSVFDNLDTNIIYTSSYNSGFGIYKSPDNGDTWLQKNTGIYGPAFRMTQDFDGKLYVTHYASYGGGVWRSENRAELWENVSDPIWATAGTWGVDARNGRIVVGVGGHGIFAANTDGSAILPPGPNPVVFIPGLGGSWSTKGLIQNEPTTYSDWILLPKLTDSYYQPLLKAIPDAHVFAYDYRQHIADSANWLNDFLSDKLPGKKANIVGHSMGGLVARYCYQMTPGCAGKIDKIITAGTPHQGAMAAYKFWEAGQIDGTDLMILTAEKLFLHLAALPDLSTVNYIHTNFPGVADLLPVYPLNALLLPNMGSGFMTMSSSKFLTDSSFDTIPRNPIDVLFNKWLSGKPGRYYTGSGDKTVLQISSQGPANKDYPVNHGGYFQNSQAVSDVLSAFGLSAPYTGATAQPANNFLIVYSDTNASIDLVDNNGSPVGEVAQGAIFADNVSGKSFHIGLTGKRDGNFKIGYVFAHSNGQSKDKSFDGTIQKGERKNIDVDLN